MKATTTVLCMAVLSGSLAAKAQQPTPTYSFRPIVQPGMTIADHRFTDDTAVNDIALNDAGEVGFIAGWTIPGEEIEHTGVFTSRRIVARDGDVVGGKSLMTIVSGSLAINNAGRVAYEADFFQPPAVARGVFLDREFVFAINPNVAGTGPDFILTEDGKILPRPGLRLELPPAAAPASEPAKKKGVGFGNLGLHLPDTVTKHIPLTIKPNNTKTDPQTQPATPTPAQPKPVAPPAAPTFPKPAGPCAMPAFPMPEEWQIGAEAEGPAASHAFEPEVSGRKYFSQLYGPLNAPFRIAHFNRACKPLLIAIGDINAKGRLEVWTPTGLMTFQKPGGSYELKGFAGAVKSPSFLRTDSAIPINRRGQVALYVTLSPEGHALLRGTPESR
jgi:hypothetical protein